MREMINMNWNHRHVSDSYVQVLHTIYDRFQTMVRSRSVLSLQPEHVSLPLSLQSNFFAK